jgi:Flp pilus assembly protein TadG
MFSIRKLIGSTRGQGLVELTLMIPMLIALGLGVVEVGNMINSYLVMSHLTREAANLASRQPGTKGSTQWATNINNGMTQAITSASPVIHLTGTGPSGPSQFKVYYSMVEWNPAAGPCGGGPIASGAADNYRIRRTSAGWPSNTVNWEYGSLGQPSQVGAHGSCAYLTLPEVKNLSTQGIVLHVVEVVYDYGPAKLTPVQNFIGILAPGIFYRRSVFMDVVG